MQKVRKLKESKGRDRCLSASEKEALLKACRESKNPFLYHIVHLALLTGMRYGEIVKLRWEDVNFELRYATLQQTKNGEKRVIQKSSDPKQHLAVQGIGVCRMVS